MLTPYRPSGNRNDSENNIPLPQTRFNRNLLTIEHSNIWDVDLAEPLTAQSRAAAKAMGVAAQVAVTG